MEDAVFQITLTFYLTKEVEATLAAAQKMFSLITE
jgi:hypothetical protein